MLLQKDNKTSRAYNAKLVALAVGVPDKWVDNLLSHHDIPGVSRGRQGVERRISDEGLLAIEAVKTLTRELGMPIATAANVVRAALAARASSEMRFTVESGVTLVFPVLEIERRLRERMIAAVEAVGRVRRGRPRRASS